MALTQKISMNNALNRFKSPCFTAGASLSIP